MKQKIVIVVKGSGRGVINDVEILKKSICNSCDISVKFVPIKTTPDYFCYGRLSRLLPYFYGMHLWVKSKFSRLSDKPYDLAIYIESIRPSYMFLGKKNILIPNQEWFFRNLTVALPYFDEVWCKTHYAQSIFSSYAVPCKYIGFSSRVDKSLRNQAKDKSYFLHRAGNSSLRGSKQLIKVWLKHPEWPLLKLIIDEAHRHDLLGAGNIEYITPPELDSDFERFMAATAYHIHPTETEGYGLSISEGLGYGCLILATDAEPMNELVSTERGVLMPAIKKGTFNLSDLFEVTESGLEAAIISVLEMSDADFDRVSATAMGWFDDNQRKFSQQINKAVDCLLAAP